MCWRPLQALIADRNQREPSGLSCEIVSDLCPNPFSHDWHVQPNFQRPNRIPPKRREFSPVRLASSANPTVLETFQTYRAQQTRVNASPAQNFHPISTVGSFVWGGRLVRQGFQPRQMPKSQSWKSGAYSAASDSIERKGFSFRGRARRYSLPPHKQPFSAHAEAEDKKLRKDLNAGGPCFEGTLRKPTWCFRIKPRGRGD